MLHNEFSWSKSRDQVFRECLRKYWFTYYGSWGGWEPGAPPRVRELYILKNLDTRATWAGRHVHTAIHRALMAARPGGAAPAADAAEAAGADMLTAMRREFADSRKGRYREDPRKFRGLFEHEYKVEVSDAAWKETADHAAACLRCFFASDLPAAVRTMPPGDWLEAEERASFMLNGLKVVVVLDFARRRADDILIYDWKTGRGGAPDRHDLQLGVYALYAMEKWQALPGRVTAIEFNLAENQRRAQPPAAERLEELKSDILDSADEMLVPLADPAHNIAREEDFDLAEDETPCARCVFVKVCPRFAG